MKKTLAAVAVLGAFAASASADVTVYGKVDMGLMYTNTDGVEKIALDSGVGGNTSRIGFKGQEKIGDMTVGFVYETGLSADDGTANKTFNNRDSHVFIKGAYGELGLGYYGVLDASTGPYSISGKISAAGTGWGGDILAQDVVIATDTRWGNAATYVSPAFAGVKLYAQVASKAEAGSKKTVALDATKADGLKWTEAGENPGAEFSHNADMYMGVGADYQNGALGATLVVSSVKYKNADDQDDSLNVVGGVNYDFGCVKAFLGANYYENGEVGHDQYGVVLSALAPVAGGKLYASAGYGEVNALDDDGAETETKKMYAGVGYTYNLSKQTFLYGAYNWKRVDDGETADTNEAVFGIVHNF